MPGQMVDPPFLSQLGHDCIDPREACLALCPLCQGFRVPVPGDLDADGVPLHTIKLRVVCGCCVEELPPQKLSIQREGGRAVPLYLLIQLPETIVEQAAGQAAKTQVGTESCRAGQQ